MLLRIKKVFLSKSRQSLHTNSGWFYKLALMDFGLIWGDSDIWSDMFYIA